MTISTQPEAASSNGTHACHIRSPCLSELAPKSGISTAANSAGIAAMAPTAEKLASAAKARTICGAQVVFANWRRTLAIFPGADQKCRLGMIR